MRKALAYIEKKLYLCTKILKSVRPKYGHEAK